MMTFKTPPAAVAATLAALFALSCPAPVLSQTKSPEDAQALLQDVKKRDLERQIAAKQTELNRLNEDLTKGRNESEDLKRSIEGLGVAVAEAAGHLDQLSAERTRLTQALEVTNLRIDAEKLKLSGLKMLSDAQGKVLVSLTSRIDDTELKAATGTAEMKLMSEEPNAANADAGPAEGPSKLRTQLTDLRKKRAKSERATAETSAAAREAMQAASAKLAVADTAAGKAKKRADDLGLAEVAEGPDQKDAITAPKAIPVR